MTLKRDTSHLYSLRDCRESKFEALSLYVDSTFIYILCCRLTAFVTKVMCQAKEFAFIDDSITCNAMKWLISQTQEDDGSFKELYRVHHAEMTVRN